MWQKFKELFVSKDEQLEEKEELCDVVESEAEQPVADGGDFNALLRRDLAPAFRADGFSGSGRNFRKVTEHWIAVINIESARAGNGFALNLGLHPRAFQDVLGKEVDPKKLKVQLCEFRTRLPSQNKQTWWQFDTSEASMQAAVAQAREDYLHACRTQLHRLCGGDSPLLKAVVDDFAKGDYDFSPFQGADARIALVIARMHRHHGRNKEALAFAHYGLRHVGNSVGLRRDFEALLQIDVS